MIRFLPVVVSSKCLRSSSVTALFPNPPLLPASRPVHPGSSFCANRASGRNGRGILPLRHDTFETKLAAKAQATAARHREAEDHALGRRPVACRTAYRFLGFELLDEFGEMRGSGGREGVVLNLEALPNC